MTDLLDSQLNQLSDKTRFSYPDPTMVSLIRAGVSEDNLVLTKFSEKSIPSLYFYRIPAAAKDQHGEINGQHPTFKIDRAELLIDCDDNGTISFLTNGALLSADPDHFEFTRLQSPSQVVKITLDVLKSL